MRFELLRKKISQYPVFTFTDILKWFPEVNLSTLKVDLNKWIKKGYLRKIKKGLFWFPEVEIPDQFYLAEKLLSPSYISLETALNYYGIIPDVPQKVISLTPLTTRKFKTIFGDFWFCHIKKDYFFGFKSVYSDDKRFFYNIAVPEKALLDFIYFNLKRLKEIKDFSEERFCFDKFFSWKTCLKMAKVFQNKKVFEITKKIYQFYEKDKI